MTKLYLIVLCFLGTCLLHVSAHAQSSIIRLDIAPGTFTYAGPASMMFSTPITESTGWQTLEEEFLWAANYFWIMDHLGSNSGYYTTLQLSGDLYSANATIPAIHVLRKSLGTIHRLAWVTNPNIVFDALSSWYQSLDSARTFIYRDSWPNGWIVWYYAANIGLKINIPPDQPPGTYIGTLLFTLMEY